MSNLNTPFGHQGTQEVSRGAKALLFCESLDTLKFAKVLESQARGER